MILLIVFLLFYGFVYSGCFQKKNNLSEGLPPYIESSINNDSILYISPIGKKIVEGAIKNLNEGSAYDLSMAYYVLQYQDGEFKGKKIYPGGDLDPSIGVCTDVIIRSLRYAGISDLQEAVHNDILKNKNSYPLSRWNSRKPDPNIDHRRVMNLEVYFLNNWTSCDGINFLPGDIVVWDMNEDSASDHIGIVSDKKSAGTHLVIHSHPDPGHIAEEDKLFKWKISGHYRIQDQN